MRTTFKSFLVQLTGTLPGASWADSPAVFLRHLDLSDNHIEGWSFDEHEKSCSCCAEALPPLC